MSDAMDRPWIARGIARAVALGACGSLWAASCRVDVPQTDTPASGSTATVSAAVGPGPGPASASSSSGGSSCPPQAFPPGAPADWQEWSEWSCNCRFYVPGEKGTKPPPIVWEPCPPIGIDVDCRRMKVDWITNPFPMGIYPQFDPSGTAPLMMFTRNYSDHFLILIAEPDGLVHNALMIPAPNGVKNAGCFDSAPDLNAGHYAFAVSGDDARGQVVGSPDGGAGEAVIAPSPKLLGRFAPNSGVVWNVGRNYLVRGDNSFTLVAAPWSLSPETIITSPQLDPDGLPNNQEVWNGDALFWGTITEYMAGINVWTKESGARPFIRWVHSTSQGAADFGTDGADMVWSYGERDPKAPLDTPWPTRSIMTAPFTTDSATAMAAARRLRSAPDTCIGCQRWIVGCGYAANEDNRNGTIVVRIKDGWSWTIPVKVYGQGFNMPFGMTCDEVFIGGQIDGQFNIHRIRLGSLGPGMPPD